MGRLDGKVAIITGGASGLGAATVERFAEEGARVVVADLDGDAARAVAARVDGLGVAVDVGDVQQTEAMAAAALDAFGAIDVVFANAGVPGEGSAHDMDPAAWDRVIRINLTGVYLTVRAALPAMMQRGGGSAILTASTAAVSGLPSLAPYTAAKAGVVGLARQLAIDYAQHAIRANAICPGTIPTPLVRAAYEQRGGDIEERIAARAADVPLGRMGDPSDVANLALFLASDESKWITGQVHVVDGGVTCAMVPRASDGVRREVTA
jgi:NAD(P)-dependent dehydrogenase (short-subunit alcohol dehydrogenase family)